MKVTRNVILCKETEKAYLIKFASSKKTAWIPKQYIELYDVEEDPFGWFPRCKADIDKWILDKVK
jgi:hypothetical protein